MKKTICLFFAVVVKKVGEGDDVIFLTQFSAFIIIVREFSCLNPERKLDNIDMFCKKILNFEI